MKALVVYYSQTGNTKTLAKAIQAGMGAQLARCDLAALKDVSTQDLAEYDIIGLGSPVWHRQEPANVTRFIEFTLSGVEGKHAFTFCTHGLLPGRFFARVVPVMTQRGLSVIGWKNWYCSVSMPEKPKPYFTDGHPDDIDLAEAEAFGKEMALRSEKIAGGAAQLIPELPRGREYDELYPGVESLGPADPNRKVFVDLRDFDLVINPAKCGYPKCTVCVDNCPTDSINMTVSPPRIRKSCDRCWFCEQICPRGAIEVDWEPVIAYVKQHIIQRFSTACDVAESKGRFRRLVPKEKVGWDTYWAQIKKPPRLKLP
jgi:flavodoxin/Fe-S-cluster-containing hydrogenase component 2